MNQIVQLGAREPTAAAQNRKNFFEGFPLSLVAIAPRLGMGFEVICRYGLNRKSVGR
jgi:hypothetical protein